MLQEYAETAMNEFLGWYGYDKVDSKDTQGLDLHHFGRRRRSAAGTDDDSSDDARSSSPNRKDLSSTPSGKHFPTLDSGK